MDERRASTADADDAVEQAVAAYAHALRLSCRAAREPGPGAHAAALANQAVAAHVAARAWAEAAVSRAAAAGGRSE